MAASEMRTSHGMAMCQECLNRDSKLDICKSCEWRNGVYVMQESTYQMQQEATNSTTAQRQEATTITSETPPEEVLPTILDLDPIEEKKSLAAAEQPIDKINISAFVSDFNSDSPDSSSEVKTLTKNTF